MFGIVYSDTRTGKVYAKRTVIDKFIKETDIEGKIKNRTLIIPGKVAVLKGELEEKLPGWEIKISPNEASGLVKFMKDL